MNSEGSTLRPVTLAELQATETRISHRLRDLMRWIEESDSRSPHGVESAQVVRERINDSIEKMNHEITMPTNTKPGRWLMDSM